MHRRVAASLGRGRQTEQDCPKNLIALHNGELRKAQHGNIIRTGAWSEAAWRYWTALRWRRLYGSRA